MSVPGCSIYSLVNSNFAVANYPEKVESEEDKAILKKLRFMRDLELAEKDWMNPRGPSGGQQPPPGGLRNNLLLDTLSFASGEEEYVVNWWPMGGKPKASDVA